MTLLPFLVLLFTFGWLLATWIVLNRPKLELSVRVVPRAR